jgi:hypothetical protein
MQWQEHTKCSNSSRPNLTKATNAMERYERKNQGIHKELQDLDPLCYPHLEKRLIGGNIDLDLLSHFPQRYATIMGRIKRGTSFPRSKWWERERERERERGKMS